LHGGCRVTSDSNFHDLLVVRFHDDLCANRKVSLVILIEATEVPLKLALGLGAVNDAGVREASLALRVVYGAGRAGDRHTGVAVDEPVRLFDDRVLDFLMDLAPLGLLVFGNVRPQVVLRAQLDDLTGANVGKPRLNAIRLLLGGGKALDRVVMEDKGSRPRRRVVASHDGSPVASLAPRIPSMHDCA